MPIPITPSSVVWMMININGISYEFIKIITQLHQQKEQLFMKIFGYVHFYQKLFL